MARHLRPEVRLDDASPDFIRGLLEVALGDRAREYANQPSAVELARAGVVGHAIVTDAADTSAEDSRRRYNERLFARNDAIEPSTSAEASRKAYNDRLFGSTRTDDADAARKKIVERYGRMNASKR
jgi:hypothetical protein